MENLAGYEFTLHDAIILHCIRLHRRGATLATILGDEDMVDRNYSTCAELDLILRRFIAIGLITPAKNRFLATPKLRDYFPYSRYGRHTSLIDVLKQLQHSLNAMAEATPLDSIRLPAQLIDETAYQQALKLHHYSMSLPIGICLAIVAVILYVLWRFTLLCLVAGVFMLLIARVVGKFFGKRSP